MRSRIVPLLGVLVTIVVALPAPGRANDSAAERTSLTGLSTLSVVVEGMGAVAEHNGLKDSDLERDIQARLRQAGIRTTPDADAYLYVQVTVVDPGGSEPLSYMVAVSLMQEVTLPRGVQTRTPFQSPTWWLNTVGVVSPDGLSRAVKERTSDFVDRFIKAYQTVNPKS